VSLVSVLTHDTQRLGRYRRWRMRRINKFIAGSAMGY
jgi:hypothetical protein